MLPVYKHFCVIQITSENQLNYSGVYVTATFVYSCELKLQTIVKLQTKMAPRLGLHADIYPKLKVLSTVNPLGQGYGGNLTHFLSLFFFPIGYLLLFDPLLFVFFCIYNLS